MRHGSALISFLSDTGREQAIQHPDRPVLRAKYSRHNPQDAGLAVSVAWTRVDASRAMHAVCVRSSWLLVSELKLNMEVRDYHPVWSVMVRTDVLPAQLTWHRFDVATLSFCKVRLIMCFHS